MGHNLWIALFLIVLSPRFLFADTPKENTNINEKVIIEAVQNGITSFTLKLYQLLQENNTKNDNILFSPTNLYAALALVHLGSEGITQGEIADLMGLPKTAEVQQVHQSIKTLLTSAQKQREGRTIQDGQVIKVNFTTLNFADGIFVQNGLSLNENYLADTKNYYDSEIINVDFKNKGNEATEIINQYIANKTENRIPKLYSEPQSPDTRIVLTSSLYFKSKWEAEFTASATKPDVFYTENSKITVDMMHKVTDMPYANIPSLGLEAVKLWFIDRTISMFIVLPYENQTLNGLLQNLTTEDINEIINETESYQALRYVDCNLPKTTFKWSKNINQELIHLGVKKIFSEEAELKNMVNESNLKVSEVNHATDIKIMEEGTEATAVTSIQIGLRTMSHPKRATFHVNRPFLTFIYHHIVKSILFFGSVHNPNG